MDRSARTSTRGRHEGIMQVPTGPEEALGNHADEAICEFIIHSFIHQALL